jgi:hypothetical protein
MNDEVTCNRDATTWVVRNKDDFRIPIYKRTYKQISMWYNGFKLFSELTPAMN